MVQIKATGMRLAGKVKDRQLIVTEQEEVKEVWINTGGFFDSNPNVRNVGVPAFRLPSSGRHEVIDESYRLWKFDPLGGSIVRTTTFFVLGRGLTFQFDDEIAQFYAKKFFKRNNLEVRLRAASDELTAFGEVYVWLRPKFADEVSGSKNVWRLGDTQVTFIPPENITNVETSDDDVGDVHNFVFEWQDAEMADHMQTIPHISKYDVESDAANEGCIIQIVINSGNIDAFGHGDLLSIKEWLDNYQEYLRDGVIINKLYRSPCFDISIEDGNQDEVNAAIARYRGWSIGSNPVHNSREQWQVLEFTGPNSSNEEARRALLLIIAAGVGFAEFMLADGSNSNLASSKSQQLPVVKKFEDRQDLWAHYLNMIFQFMLEVKAKLKSDSGLTLETDREGDPKDFPGTLEFPGISVDRDLEVAQTNELALEGKYMSVRTAAARLGLDFDREMEKSRNDVESMKELQKMLISAGLMNDPTKPPPGKEPPLGSNGRQGGQADGRTPRDRSRESGGANAPVTT